MTDWTGLCEIRERVKSLPLDYVCLCYACRHMEDSRPEWCIPSIISRVSDQNGVSPLRIMLEIHHSGREPSIYSRDIPFWSETLDIIFMDMYTVPHKPMHTYIEIYWYKYTLHKLRNLIKMKKIFDVYFSCFRHGRGAQHFKILSNGDGEYYLWPNKTFPSINKLIDHHRTVSIAREPRVTILLKDMASSVRVRFWNEPLIV